MKAAIVQSSYIPWRGYFDIIRSVDVFVFLDDIPFGSKGSWRHRNAVKTESGLRWLTVPVRSKRDMLIKDVEICYTETKSWLNSHRELLSHSLCNTPYLKDAMELWESGAEQKCLSISELNVKLIKAICSYLGIKTKLIMSSELDSHGLKTERLVSILRSLGADVYLSGPSARDYIDETCFMENGISLYYKTYDYASYKQQWGAFAGNVSVLDLIANCGKEAVEHISSKSPDILAVAA